MSERTLIDTLFVVALVNQRDQHHERAAELAEEYEDRLFLVTDVVLLEIGNALAKAFRPEAIKLIDGFLSSPDVEVVHLSPGLFKEAWDLYRSHRDKEWGLVDCVSFVVMRNAGVKDALTFDQHFVQAGFTALMRKN